MMHKKKTNKKKIFCVLSGVRLSGIFSYSGAPFVCTNLWYRKKETDSVLTEMKAFATDDTEA